MANKFQLMVFYVLAVYLLLVTNTEGRKILTESPLNDAVLLGDTVVLSCTVAEAPPSSRIMWAEFITDSGGAIISDNEVILDHPNKDRYTILHPTETEYHLEIRDVALSDGGKYVCQDTLAGPPDIYRGEAELIVLASTPNCTSTAPPDNNVVEGQTHTIECSISYQGLYAPEMHWSGPPPYIVAAPPSTPTSVWSGVEYVVNRTMDTRAFECLTNFTELPTLPEGVADNTPSWSHLYRAPQMFVFWGPTNVHAEPIKSEYQVGDEITCYADAWPPASYTWHNMRTLESFISQVFTITSDLQGTNQTLRCQAQNTINGFVYSENYFMIAYVPAPTTPTSPTTTPPTTTQPAVSNCFNLTGSWQSSDPSADLILETVKDSEIGEITGLFKRDIDTIWVEVVGTTSRADWAYIGLTVIWPTEADGVSGYAGECHRCDGVEVLIVEGLQRAIVNSPECAVSGPITLDQGPYFFYRTGTVKSAIERANMNIHNPTSISQRLGVDVMVR